MVLNAQTISSNIDEAPRTITILGSTGSVGVSTVDLLMRNSNNYLVDTLTANQNVTLLAEQAEQLNAKNVVIADETKYLELKDYLSGKGINIAAGTDSLIEAVDRPTDIVMAAIVGAAGLEPTLRAVQNGTVIALANKECLVSAGNLFCSEVARYGAQLIPVDSEHSAIFQVLDVNSADKISRIIVTASGGPFRNTSIAEMKNASPAEAIAHPNWDMGEKISIDSATMMNKGLELIEAFHLFPVSEKQIEVVVHPESIVHSLVEYVDGSVLAQLGSPDMRTPIAYALAWPKRMEAPSERLNLWKVGTLNFELPDENRFPALRLAREALKTGGSAPTILNAANEIAVDAFLNNRIGFLDIAMIVEKTLSSIETETLLSIEDVIQADTIGRRIANNMVP
ncbi:MAG: 1-deoxy-D-xylulose 5-phosphate reductoisomerase [Alphaproteobacteria bacterium MarineAlpha3_Bin5]|nr:1-deoxy-D-xylulose-5-phosphate reductoisomerase [Magnetovibrio sp.]PPR76533.1 MAG: 1-deoxy-D-xylulose 5-phosphate reductoisomerase [Alphaproteobacteria bacterium MarineAlpha3_Bin5]